jgi:hypothetical protein
MSEPTKTEEQKFTPEVEKSLAEATSSDQIRDIVSAQPRDEKGKFVSTTAAPTTTTEKKDPDPNEPTVYKDTFLIGGKEVEFTGDSPADVLKQVKVAQQTWEMAKKPEPKVEPVKPAVSAEELAALQLKASTGDLKAHEEYLVKSGFLDRYLESKGFKPDEYKQVLQERASDKVAKDWNGAVQDFLKDSDWPGGTQNEKLLKYKLAELKDDKGQPLAYSPSKDSLLKAYEALKAENMLFPREEQKPEEKKDAATATTTVKPATTAAGTPPVQKRAATGSTAFGTSQESGTRRTTPASKAVPQITDDMTPQQIMDAFKEASIAAGQSPDDALRATYAGRS